MPSAPSSQDLILGTIRERTIRLSPATLAASYEQARSIAVALGSNEPQTSMESYWSLAARVRQWQQIVDRIGMARALGTRFVEIGSGLGLFTLTGCALGFNVIGLDSSSDRYNTRMRIAQHLFIDNQLPPRVVQAYSEQLPLPTASADVVATFQTIEHVGDVPATLREIRRVLKPGGRLFAQLPNYRAFHEAHYGVFFPLGLGKQALRRYLRLRRKPTAFVDHLQWVDPINLRDQLTLAGFRDITIGRFSQPSYRDGPLPAEPAPLPFRWKRGRLPFRVAHNLARVTDRLHLDSDLYPQLEIWATA